MPNERENGGSVLVVDDDYSVRALISTTLKRNGFDVTMATNGRIGVEHVRATPDRYKLILLDNHMPEMDGLTACRVIRQFAPKSPVVLMSSETEPDDLEASGAREFFPKPFQAADLINLVDRHIVS
ncbi:MAG: response regulator [Gammaproteobacteria bacterium]|nr:response regulator [Gammaproteobacteria bacterium]MDH3768102.1 response regulator [Gammaproteobacteria bacterium]